MVMATNKVFRSQKDLSRLDVNNPAQVEYVHYQFPWLTHQQIKDAIRQHGPDRKSVQAYLESIRGGTENKG